MTRFARAAGSKSCNKKLPEDGTPWSLLKGGMNNTSSNLELESESSSSESDDNELQAAQVNKHMIDNAKNKWSIIVNPTDSAVSKAVKRKREEVSSNEFKSIKLLRNVGWRCEESEVKKVNEIQDKLLNEGKNPDEVNEISKETKKLNRVKCYQCQQVGHMMGSCPEKKELDICFICGSTEHKFRDCKMKKPNQEKFQYATCFICKEQGHLSSCCPDNPTGLYPYGGGCHSCGDVTHFARDCPKRQKTKEMNKMTLPTISGDVEGLPDDKLTIKKTVTSKKANVVKF